MRAWRAVAAVSVWSALAVPAVGQPVSTDVLDLEWGTAPWAVVQAYPDAQCFGERSSLSDWRCILTDANVNDISVDVVLYGYRTGKAPGLAGVVLGFDSADVHRILEAFVARYGRWSRVAEHDFVTKAEKPFRSAIWLWNLPNVEIRVEQDRGTLGHGQATIMYIAGLEELRAREGTW